MNNIANELRTSGACLPEDISAIYLRKAKEKFANFFTSNEKSKVRFQGQQYCGQSNEATYIDKLLGQKTSSSWQRQAEQKCYKSEGNCLDTVCSLSLAYGSQESALRALVIAKRDGYAMSLDRSTIKTNVPVEGFRQAYEPVPWKVEEIRAADEMLAKLPAHFKNLPTLKEFHRLPKENELREPGEGSAFAMLGQNKIAVKYSTYTTPEIYRLILAHELMHQFDYVSEEGSLKKPFRELMGFNQLSGWKKISSGAEVEEWTHDPKAKFARDYTAKNPSEDFADSIAYYIEYAQDLLNIDPKKYAWIKKNIFEGKEFLEKEKWRAREKEIAKLGGKDGLIQTCINNIRTIEIYPKAKSKLVLQSKYEGNLSWAENAREFLNYGNEGARCIYAMRNKLEKALVADPDFCLWGGSPGLTEAISNEMKVPFQKLMDNLEAYVQTKDKNFTNLGKVIRETEGFSELSPETQKLIIEQFTKMLPKAISKDIIE